MPLGISIVPSNVQKEPDSFQDGYYEGPEGNGPEGQRRGPPE
jgi:hypothetical protein